jgi:flavin reductase (DIM6/NTAB) family NADH-FMN oxidoreductase RutF
MEDGMSDAEAGKALAAALGRVPSGLFVLTARHGEAETGLLTSWVQQCSFEPPQVSVAVRRERPVLDWLTPGSAFTLNVLSEGQTALLKHFGRGFTLEQPAFVGLDIERSAGAAPVLSAALAVLNCCVASRLPTGDHELLIATVFGGRLQGAGRPYVHMRKNGLSY